MYWWGICVAIRVLSHVIGAQGNVGHKAKLDK